MDLNNLQRGSLKNMQEHRTGLDKDAMWNAMQGKKKRRPFFWLWTGASVFLIGMIGLYFSSDFEKSTPIANVNSIEKINIETTNPNNNATEKIETTISNLASENSLINNAEKDKIASSFTKNSKSESTNFSIKNTNYQTQSFSNFVAKKEPVNLNIGKAKTQIALAKSNFSEYSNTNKKENSNELLEMELLPIRLADLAMETEIKLESPSLKEVKRIKLKPQADGFRINIYAGIGSHFNELEKKSPIVFDDYFNFRKEKIKPLESYTFGIGLTRSINNQWNVGSGLEMVIYQESVIYQNTMVENTGTFDPNSLPVGSSQNTFLVTKENSTYFNQFYQLNAPIFLGYKMNTRKIRIEPQLGVVLNWNHSSNGEFKNEEDVLTDLQPFYKKGFGLSYRFGCKFGYALGNQTLLSLHPKFDLNPNDWTTTQNIIAEKRNAFRLDLGISKAF